jgi:CheY-like chemotaxis protein
MVTGNKAETEHKNILVIDDDYGIREALKAALEYEGYSVYTAENGQIALDLIQGGLRPCLIVLDLMMPVMDGWAFADRMAADQAYSTIPIVVVSAFDDKAPDIKAKSIFKKPVNLKALFEVIKKWCSQEGLSHG